MICEYYEVFVFVHLGYFVQGTYAGWLSDPGSHNTIHVENYSNGSKLYILTQCKVNRT